jgi:hypothetical protein
MNLIKQVYATLKWKQSDAVCAVKLGIPLEKYQEIKQHILQTRSMFESEIDDKIINLLYESSQLRSDSFTSKESDDLKEQLIEFKENLEEGTAEFKGISSTEPKSPEEIIRILKIDTEKWKLSSYWNKQQRDQWLISAMVTHKQVESKDLLLEAIKDFKPEYKPIKDVFTNSELFEIPVAGVLSIQDLHFGKQGNTTVINDFKNSVNNLLKRAYRSHNLQKLYYVIGGDLLNMDTFDGTTTKGTPVQNDQVAQEAYNQAFDALYWSVNMISQFCKELHVIYLPGNHDRLSSYHLAHALSKCFIGAENITFDVEYSERKVVTYGSNFFAFEHGDVNSKNTALVYATEFPVQWGNTHYRTCYTGHWHRKKTMEYITEDEHHGFAIKQLPSLSRSDYWHYHNKFTGAKRQAILEIHDPINGKVSEFIYTA